MLRYLAAIFAIFGILGIILCNRKENPKNSSAQLKLVEDKMDRAINTTGNTASTTLQCKPETSSV